MPDPITLDDIALLRELRVETTPASWHFEREADAAWVCALHNAADALLDLAELALSGEKREEWGVRYEYPIDGAWDPTAMFPPGEREARASLAQLRSSERARNVTLHRRIVITGPWIEESTDG